MWKWGWYFVNNSLIKIQINIKVLSHICDTYYFDYLTLTTFHLYLIDFQLNTDFPS